MPTPLQLLLDPVSLIVLSMFGGLMLLERLAPGRALPRVAGWRLRGLVAFVTFFFVSSYLPLFWDAHLAAYQLFDLTGLGLGGAAIGFVLYEFGTYAWHRSMHSSKFLWRVVHQMHHSAERVDIFGAFYFSPIGMVAWTALGSLALVVGVGITPQAATVVILVVTFLGMFQHTNVKTPRWLGYIVQRPESHTVHHARGVHFSNFADLPLFDILFGTFDNPESYERETGFYHGASARVPEMLMFKDVSEAPSVDAATNVSWSRPRTSAPL